MFCRPLTSPPRSDFFLNYGVEPEGKFLRFSSNLFFFAETVEIADLFLKWLTFHAQTLSTKTHIRTHTLAAL